MNKKAESHENTALVWKTTNLSKESFPFYLINPTKSMIMMKLGG